MDARIAEERVKRRSSSVPRRKTDKKACLDYSGLTTPRGLGGEASRWKGKDAFSRHELWCPMEQRSRPPDHLRGRGPLGMHHWRTVDLAIPCRVARQQSPTPFHPAR